MAPGCRWPPLTPEHWQVEQRQGLEQLQVQLNGLDAPTVQVPSEAAAMGGRLLPLLQVASLAAWRLGQRDPALRFSIQLHDEAPIRAASLRFDADWDDHEVLLPDPYALGSLGYLQIRQQLQQHPLPCWGQRIPMAFWRGSSTGIGALTTHRLGRNRRYQLCQLSQRMPQLLDARITAVVQCRDAQAAMEVQQQLNREALLAQRCSPRRFGEHQFLIEIDGNVNSWGLLWKLLSGSCVLRVASERRQWYHRRLKPYQHVVPVAADLSDLPQQLSWCRANPLHCEQIAAAGQRIAEEEVQHLGRRVVQAIDSLSRQE